MRTHQAKVAVLALALFLAFGATALAQSGLQKSEVAVDIPSLQGSITVDGALSESVWSNALRIAIPEILYTSVDPSDLSGDALIFWNASGLYVAFEVTDDDLQLAGERADLWAYDSASVWLDNLWIQVGLDQDGNSRARLDYLEGFPPFEADYDVAVVRSDNGYVVELFVPARVLEAALGSNWSAGAQYAFAVGLSDRDEGDRSSASPRYFPNWFGWNNVESMATATLK